MKKLEARPDLGIDKRMREADRPREKQELEERDAPHLVAVQAAAGGLRQQYVERDVCGYQPEIDDGMQRPRKQQPGKPGIDRGGPSKGVRQDEERDLRAHSE